MSSTILAIAFCLVTIDGLSALDKTPSPTALLEQGLVAQNAEQDLGAAEKLFRQVLDDEEGTAEHRERAALLLGLCLEMQGRDDEARTAFAKAENGKREFAQQAREILNGLGESRQRLKELIVTTSEASTGGFFNSKDQSKTLAEFGEPVAPIVIELLDEARGSAEPSAIRSGRQRFLASSLLQIGGPRAITYIDKVVRSNDAVDRHIFWTALTSIEPDLERRDVFRAFLPLLHTGNDKARRTVFGTLGWCMSPTELLDLQEDEVLQPHALEYVLQGAPLEEAIVEQLVRFLRSALPAPPLLHNIVHSKSGRYFILESVFEERYPGMNFADFASKIPPNEFLAAVKRSPPKSPAVKTQIEFLMQESLKQFYWKTDAVPAVLGLVDGGFNPSFVCGVRSEELLGQRRQITLPINQVRESRDRRCQALDVAIEFFAGRRRSTALPRLARSAQDLGKFSKIL
jgi:hypothetical protein